ncbi:MAG: carbohydrate-binding protein, partial [Spirochaetales bacterium]|nr:carbohydrate-binding protein [Spirochaetales bacterium]
HKSNTIFCEAEDAAATGGTFSDRNDANMEATAAKDSSELDNLAFNGRGYVSQWGHQCGDALTFNVNIKKAGRYAIDIRYQNGNGPVNTGSGCGIAAVSIDGTIVRRLPLAQRGSWLNWGFSSAVTVDLPKGQHTIVLLADEYCHNERGSYNPVNIDCIRIARINE